MTSRLALLALASLAAFAPALAYTPAPSTSADARRLAAVLDYVSGDYAEAVSGGAVVDAHEYEEQLELLEEARGLASRLAVPLVERVGGLEGQVRAHADPTSFASEARAVRREVVTRYAVEVAPARPPDRARGAALYGQHCASCHGATGGADTEAARALTPRPRNFRDGEEMAAITPSRAFSAVTYGVEGTAMAAFPSLSADERWDLAFAVLALRFDDGAASRGAAVIGAAPSLEELADRTDAELVTRLPAAADREAAVAWLRRVAPFPR